MADVFDKQFTIHEKMQSFMTGNGAPMGVDAHWDARQTLGGVANMLDRNITRAIIQTDDISRIMIVDVFPCKDVMILKRDDANGIPLIAARVACHDRCDDSGYKDKLKPVMNSKGEVVPVFSRRGGPSPVLYHASVAESMPKDIQSIKAGCVEELDILKSFFKKNAKLLCTEFVQRFERELPGKYFAIPGGFTTFVSPLYKGEIEKRCNACNSYDVELACERCKLVQYCSVQCQQTDWTVAHQSTCVERSQLKTTDEGTYVEIDLSTVADNTVSSMIPHHVSHAMWKPQVVSFTKMLSQQKLDTYQVYKVQVTLYVDVTDPRGEIYIYSNGKQFEMYAGVRNFTELFQGYRRLFEFVKQRGDDCGYGCGGVKLFAHGMLTSDRKLRILTDKVLPKQIW